MEQPPWGSGTTRPLARRRELQLVVQHAAQAHDRGASLRRDLLGGALERRATMLATPARPASRSGAAFSASARGNGGIVIRPVTGERESGRGNRPSSSGAMRPSRSPPRGSPEDAAPSLRRVAYLQLPESGAPEATEWISRTSAARDVLHLSGSAAGRKCHVEHACAPAGQQVLRAVVATALQCPASAGRSRAPART